MRGTRRKLESLQIASGMSDDRSDDGDGEWGGFDDDDHASTDSSTNSLLQVTTTPGAAVAIATAASSSSGRRGGGGGGHSIHGVARSTYYYGYWLRNHAKHAVLSLIVAAAVFLGIVAVRPLFVERDGDNQSAPDANNVRTKKASKQQEAARQHEPDLHTLIGDFESNVRGNVSWLMDFAIIGHSKCATTTQQNWLRRHPEILMHDREIHSLKNGRPAEMVSLLYALSTSIPAPDATRIPPRIGYKAPNDIRSPEALQSLRTYWPDTKLIIGVRHPVKWFESFYNYNLRQTDHGKNGSHHFGPAEVMNVPDHAQFHLHLSQLGKTNVLDPGEQELLGPRISEQPVLMRNQVFLYEVSQPFDSRENRDERYRNDLQQFLGLSSPLDPIAIRKKRGDNYHYAIDICDRKYKYLRHRLVEDGTVAAEWILRYFLPHPDVTVSNPDRFKEILQTWSTDPCAPL